VVYRLLPWLLQQEGGSFQPLEKRWRPTGLLYVQQSRALLKDMADRYRHLSAAESELASLERANVYIQLLQRMRIRLRQSGYVWKLDHLRFIQSVASFYSDYGAILRLLKIDQSRGRFKEPPVTQGV
jgi:hypothetical protein